jgi:hypothetical protein
MSEQLQNMYREVIAGAGVGGAGGEEGEIYGERNDRVARCPLAGRAQGLYSLRIRTSPVTERTTRLSWRPACMQMAW